MQIKTTRELLTFILVNKEVQIIEKREGEVIPSLARACSSRKSAMTCSLICRNCSALATRRSFSAARTWYSSTLACLVAVLPLAPQRFPGHQSSGRKKSWQLPDKLPNVAFSTLDSHNSTTLFSQRHT